MRMQTYQALNAPRGIAGRSRRTCLVDVYRPLTWCRLAARHFARLVDDRRGLARLASMDDRMLRDIGLSRGDVHRLAGCRRAPWLPLELALATPPISQFPVGRSAADRLAAPRRAQWS
jgi:uncharacterized protein YjiS (DUF1127 family)